MKKIIVKLENVSKCFENGKYIIKDLSLEVKEGEFLTLLGPSGCGKTTILRMISGLEYVSSGKVFIDGIEVTNVDATKREVNTIFQNLAIFPHMSVFDNVAFGLKMKKVPLNEINKRVKSAIDLVELEGYESRMPSQLSGGQLQRVAIARGIVMNPKVLLLDESLCSLDLKLKRAMQLELKKIQRKLGITFIYVTHDQDEALTMSDRIVIINNGIIEQDDIPQNIYQKPNTEFVADFIGESNIINGKVTSIDNKKINVFVSDSMIFNIPYSEEYKIDDKIKLMIRPENINVYNNDAKGRIKGIIKDLVYDGAVSKLFITADDKIKLKVNVYGEVSFQEKDEIYIKINDEAIVIIKDNNYEK